MNILFITANRIGDAVLTTGLLAHLIKTYPEARFTIACGPVAADLFRAVPRLEKLILLQKQKHHGHWIKLWKTCITTRWDMIVDLRNSLITRLLFANQKYYTQGQNTGHHKVLDLASVLTLDPPPSPHLWLDEKAEQQAAKFIKEDDIVLALGPAANWPTKQWPVEKFAELAQKLIAQSGSLEGAKVMFLAAPHEKDQLAPLYAALPAEKIIDPIGQDLLTVTACLKKARLFIGNDSGLSHMAATAGTPTLALFGPGWEKIYGPWGDHTAVLRPKESTQELLDKLSWVGAFSPNLMDGITVEAALIAAEKLLEKTDS